MSRLNRNRIDVLWIEDGAAVEVPHLTTPLYMSGRYNLVIAKDATEGIRLLGEPEQKFDVVIFDLHLPPGNNEELIRRYQAPAQRHKLKDPFGLSIIIDLFDPDELERPRVIERPEWLTPDRVGLLTVVPITSVSDVLDKLGIDKRSYRQKGATMPATALMDLIDDIYQRRQSRSESGGEE